MRAYRSSGCAVLAGDLATKALGRPAQGELGVDLQAPRDVDERKQDVADPALPGLAELLVGKALRRRLASDPGADRAPLDLARIEQRRQVLRHVLERLPGPALLLLALDPIPVSEDLGCGLCLFLAEHMRMTADQLLGHD